MDDGAIVAALVAGDQRGLEAAYRAYADRLFTYCRGLLRDGDAAADAVHDTFVIASQRAGQLRQPDRLRPWLYAIARNECLRLLRGRGRQVPLAEVGDISAPEQDPVAGMRAAEVQELVWAAADGLNSGDREVFELSIRHELPAPEVSALLGVSTAHAHARLSRARAQLERAIGALLVARTGAEQCPELTGLLAGWEGRLTPLLRKRVSRHIESCDTCAEQQRRQLRPAALFSAYASVPWLVAPAELWPRLQRTSFDPAAAEVREALAGRAGRFAPDSGFPRPWDGLRRRQRVLASSIGVVLALLLAGGGTLFATGGELPLAAGTASSQPAPPAVTVGPTAPAPASPTGPAVPVTAEPTPTSDAAAAPPEPAPGSLAAPAPPPPPVVTTAAPEPPAPLVVEADATGQCVRGSWLLAVTATASAPLDEAELTVRDGSTAPRTYPMDLVDTTIARYRAGPLTGPMLEWSVAVTGADGRTARTDPVTVPVPDCSTATR